MTTKAQHTPGPWRQMAPSNIKGIGWTQIGTCVLGEKPIAKILPIHEKGKRGLGDFEIEEANARLIAAAPELLDALSRIANGEFALAVTNEEKVAALRFVARAAIAKATGMG